MITYKGFDKNLTCRGFQYEVGKEYETEGGISACERGFHACEHPLAVLGYYPPSTDAGLSRYCEVEQSGEIQDCDNKRCSSKIRIKAEIGLTGLVEAGVKFILDHVKRDEAPATNTGDWSAAIVEGKESFAIVTGYRSKAKGAAGCWLILSERDADGHILGVQAVCVDGEKIKPDTWYQLKDGNVVEAD